MSRNLELDFKHTCPIIDNVKSNIDGELYSFLFDFLTRYEENKNSELFNLDSFVLKEEEDFFKVEISPKIEELRNLNAEMRDVATKQLNSLSEELNDEISDLKEEKMTLESEISTLNESIEDLNEQIEELQNN